MNIETALVFSYANFLTKKRYDVLLNKFGSLEAAKLHLNANVLQSLGCRPETIAEILERIAQFNHREYTQMLTENSIVFCTIEDKIYPELLRCIPDPPIFLYAQGDMSLLYKQCFACVGTRTMTSYGAQVVQKIVPPLLHAGCTIVSGLAYGIDTKVAQVCINNKMPTVAVLGNGLPLICPQLNTTIATKILKTGGLLLSEWPLNMLPNKYAYPARNRIVAGLCQATIVIEAGERSGALITANLALEYNRDVFAVPGSIFTETFRGANALIASGQAQLIHSDTAVLQYYNMYSSGSTKKEFSPQSSVQLQVYSALSGTPQSIESLAEKLSVSAAIISAELTLLELEQVAMKISATEWVRT